MKKIIIGLWVLIVLVTGCKSKQALTSSTNVSKISEQSEQGGVNKKQWPKTVKEAVDDILSGMSSEDKEVIVNTKKEDLIKYHFGWGTGIRNSFGLWSGNKELMEDTKTTHPDDASMVIIEAVWERLQKEK